MGYRSTFTTDDWGVTMPPWFVEKWGESVHFGEGNGLPISSKYEQKKDGAWSELPSDLALVLKRMPEEASGWKPNIHLVFMGEDGALTRYLITESGAKVTFKNYPDSP